MRNETRNAVIAERADIADSSKKRKTGLLKHNCLEPGDGLWLVPCEAVHTIGMKFPIDILFLDKKRRVVKVRSNVGRWRMTGSLRAHSVLELPAGTAEASGTQCGDQLELERYEA